MDNTSDNPEKIEISTSRRGFIKKAAYTTPALLVLGTLTKSNNAQADFGLPPSLCAPNCPAAAPSATPSRQRR